MKNNGCVVYTSNGRPPLETQHNVRTVQYILCTFKEVGFTVNRSLSTQHAKCSRSVVEFVDFVEFVELVAQHYGSSLCVLDYGTFILQRLAADDVGFERL